MEELFQIEKILGFCEKVCYFFVINLLFAASNIPVLLFLLFGIPFGMVTVIIAHIVFCTPYVILSIMPKLQQMDNNLYEAALDLGCTPMKALFKAVLPQIMSGIVSGFFLAFTLSIDDFVITIFNIKGIKT